METKIEKRNYNQWKINLEEILSSFNTPKHIIKIGRKYKHSIGIRKPIGFVIGKNETHIFTLFIENTEKYDGFIRLHRQEIKNFTNNGFYNTKVYFKDLDLTFDKLKLFVNEIISSNDIKNFEYEILPISRYSIYPDKKELI